jgi:glutamyl-tRNA reductase
VVAIGANHRTAPIDFLEQLAMSGERLEKHLDGLVARDDISEAVIVSTCNRTEIFVAAERFHGAFGELRNFISDLTFLPPESFLDFLDVSHDADAVRHLFAITAGVDSVVLGEHEILGQVRSAWDLSRERGTSGSTLNLLFRHAVETGKRVRTETSIGRQITSVSHASVILAADARPTIANDRVTVVGAGSMAKGVVNFLSQAGNDSVRVLNRSAEPAIAIVGSEGRAGGLDELIDTVATNDVVFFATAAEHHLLEADSVREVMAARTTPLLIVDIALPRDVDPAIGEIEGVTLVNMDVLEAFVDRGRAERSLELPAANVIIDTELYRYLGASSAREVAPLIASLRSKVDDIAGAELDRRRSELDDLTDAQREAVEAVIRGTLSKVLHQPTVELRSSAGSSRGDRLASSLRDLFGL